MKENVIPLALFLTGWAGSHHGLQAPAHWGSTVTVTAVTEPTEMVGAGMGS